MKRIMITMALTIISMNINAQIKKVKHIVLIGCDGLGAYAIPDAEMPHLKALMKEGASSLAARSVLPSSSAVNWASMIMGAGPTFHGYTEWGSETPEIPSVVTTEYGLFPSIFSVIREQKPASKTAAIYSWGGIGYLIEKETIDYVIPTGDNDDAAVDAAVRTIKEYKPLFTFLHMDEPDGVGHNIGHRTPEYYAELKNVDDRIGRVVQAVKDAGIENETIIIVSADHGGTKKGHGGKTLDEVQIPWVIAGPSVIKGLDIKSSIITYDTGATIAWILGLKTPQVWRGQAITEVFGKR